MVKRVRNRRKIPEGEGEEEEEEDWSNGERAETSVGAWVGGGRWWESGGEKGKVALVDPSLHATMPDAQAISWGNLVAV